MTRAKPPPRNTEFNEGRFYEASCFASRPLICWACRYPKASRLHSRKFNLARSVLVFNLRISHLKSISGNAQRLSSASAAEPFNNKAAYPRFAATIG